MHATTRVRARRAVVASSVAALALVGCGEAVNMTPTQRVQNATSSVFDTESLTVSVGLDLDDESRAAIAKLLEADQAESEEMGVASDISPAAVERLLDSRIVTTVATTDGSKLSDIDIAAMDLTSGAGPENLSSSMSFVVEGDALFELRQVSGLLYARIDAAGFEKALEESGLVDELRSFTADAPPALADALAAGDWVSLDTTELTAQLQELVGEMAPTPTDGPSPDASAVADALQKLVSDAQAVITREIEITETGDDAYTVTAPLDRILRGVSPSLKSFVTEIAAQAGTSLGDMGGDMGADLEAEFDAGMAEVIKDLEGRKATLDVTLDGDRLSTVRMDVAQFLEEGDRKEMTDSGVTGLPVLVELTTEGDVQAPEGAVELDLAQIMEEAFAAFMGVAAPGFEDLEGLEGLEGDLGTELEGFDPFEGMTADDFGMTEEEFEAFKTEMGVTSP